MMIIYTFIYDYQAKIPQFDMSCGPPDKKWSLNIRIELDHAVVAELAIKIAQRNKTPQNTHKIETLMTIIKTS